MIVLYGGRLTIERRLLTENWKATIKVPSKGKTVIDLCTPEIRQAFIRAQHHYLALRTGREVEEVAAEVDDSLRCWSCSNWLPRSAECVFDFPEARHASGKFANRCSMYSADGKTNFGNDCDQGRRGLD